MKYLHSKEMREIFRSHGWPDSFDREACKAALGEWDKKRLGLA
jgi:hypothetical protein